MIPITTRSSISVNARRRTLEGAQAFRIKKIRIGQYLVVREAAIDVPEQSRKTCSTSNYRLGLTEDLLASSGTTKEFAAAISPRIRERSRP